MYQIGKKFPKKWILENMIPAAQYHPYAKIEERGFWEGLDPELKQHLLDMGTTFLGFGWKGIPATYYLEFFRSGDRTCYEDTAFKKRLALGSLVLAECVQNEGVFLNDIINGIWSLCEESSWAASAHLQHSVKTNDVLPDALEDVILDLFALETAQLLAFTYYLLKDKLDAVSVQIAKRIQGELYRRVCSPYLQELQFWWMGFMNPDVNNWAPWCISNILYTFTLACDNDQWRAAAVNKAIATLDIFMNTYGEDGACTEGPNYWYRAVGALMDALEVISNATGNQVPLQDEKLKQMGRFICNARIYGNFYMNFADAPCYCDTEPARIFRYGKSIGDEQMMAEGAEMKRLLNMPIYYARWYGMSRVMEEVRCYDEMKQFHQSPQVEQDIWLKDAQIMIARENASLGKGFQIMAKGGHNGESHNHNDIGNFILFQDGNPVFIDIGVETYTQKTFSPQRYEIWTMRSAYHNVPQIGGYEQKAGTEYGGQQARHEWKDGKSWMEIEIGNAYGKEAGIHSWKRTFLLDRGRRMVCITDKYGCEREEVLQFHFMTRQQPQIQENRVCVGEATMLISGAQVHISSQKIDVADKKLQHSWGKTLYRICVETKGKKGELQFEIRSK